MPHKQKQVAVGAFSAVAATEGITKLTTGKLLSFSEKELVDCDTNGEDQGCVGGYMEDAFDFIIKKPWHHHRSRLSLHC